MASKSTELPAYLSLRYRETGVFSEMQNAAVSTVQRIGSEFAGLGASAERAMRDATKAISSSGGMDVGVGRFRELARAQEASAAAAKQLAVASARVADAQGAGSIVAMQASAQGSCTDQAERRSCGTAPHHAQVGANTYAGARPDLS